VSDCPYPDDNCTNEEACRHCPYLDDNCTEEEACRDCCIDMADDSQLDAAGL
jgi:hypothetical protein